MALYETLGDEAGMIRLRHRLSHAPVMRGDLAAARKLVEETLARARAGRLPLRGDRAPPMLGVIESKEGNVDAAFAHQRASLELLRGFGTWAWGGSIALANLAEYSTKLGQLEESESYALEALELSRSIGDRINIVFSLAALARAARARGADERAGRLWSGFDIRMTGDLGSGPRGTRCALPSPSLERPDPVAGCGYPHQGIRASLLGERAFCCDATGR